MKEENGNEKYLVDEVEDWLFDTAVSIRQMQVGTEEYLLTVKAWWEVYQVWLDHQKAIMSMDLETLKRDHEKSMKKMELAVSIVSSIVTGGISWVGYAFFAKIMQQWEDKGHIPLGSALKGLIRGAKTPKV